MLNDALQSSYSAGTNKSFNKRLKELEGKVGSLSAEVQTEHLDAEEANIGKLEVGDINITGDLKVEQADITSITSEEANIADITSNSITTETLDAKDVDAENINAKTITATEGIETANANIENLEAETATLKELVVENIIEQLNLKLLKISDKATLRELANILQFAQEWDDVSIQSKNRPKWKEQAIVTEEQLNTPFKLQGVVDTLEDLPNDDNLDGDTYLVKNDNSPIIAVWVDNVWQEIPYPVLQMYRTADDQNKIDSDLQERIENTKVELTEANTVIEQHYEEFKQHEKDQSDKNKEIDSKINEINADIATANTEIDKRLTDAPIDGQIYGRMNGAWQNIITEGAYVPKHYDKVEKYFSDITLQKDAAYLTTSQLVTIETPLDDGSTKTQQYYLALWHLKPADGDDFTYTTKNAYDFVTSHKDVINVEVYNAINEAWEAGHIIGQNNKKEFQTLEWLDVEQPFGTSKEGDTIWRPDGEVLGTNDITSDDNGVDVNSTLSFTANTPTTTSDERSVINRRYLKDNLKLSMASAESGTGSAVLTYGKSIIDNVLDRAAAYMPNAQTNCQNIMTMSPWMHRTKDFVYYKLDNTINQSASSFSFWFSIDKDGNIINMTNPREDRGNAVAGQSDFETWMTYHPSSWDGSNDNYAYWPHTNETYGGYITIFNEGRFAGYVEDENGNSNNIYTCNSESPAYGRNVGGKSLRGDKKRILVVNSKSTDPDRVKALMIGVDLNNEEALNKCRPVQLPGPIDWGIKGLAAGKKHFFAQNGTTNSFMVISQSGAVASYVLADPTTQTALTATTVQHANRNFIELENGDCVFCVRDWTTNVTYFIYCNDNFEEDGTDPFVVYRSQTDYQGSTARWVPAAGNPFVEFGNFVYFFPTWGQNTFDSVSWPANVTLTSTYSRFNKTTKSWSDAILNWTNSSVNSGVLPLKTHDPIEDADYLWVFQCSAEESTTAPTQAQVLVISESGATQYVDLGTGSSIHWFNNTAKSGESLLANWAFPLNTSGNANYAYAETARPILPYAAVTEEGIGIMLSNAAHDVCIFYGNAHFAIYSYSEATEGGPWSYFTTTGTNLHPVVLGGKYGIKFYANFNNALETYGGDGNASSAMIYIKPTGVDYLGEPQYFWKPLGAGIEKQYWRVTDGMDYAETDFSNYKKGQGKLLTSITPAYGGWNARRGMTNWETEAITSSSTLYLRDGNDVLSQVNIK